MSFTLVQQKQGQLSSNGTTLTLTLSQNIGSGNLLVVTAGAGNGSTAATLSSGSIGGTWTSDSGSTHFSSTLFGGVICGYVLSSTASGTTTLTFTFSTSNVWSAAFSEWSFTGASVSKDASNFTNNAASTTPSGQGLTLTGTNDIIVQNFIGANASYTVTIGSSYTQFTGSPNDPSSDEQAYAYLANTTSGTAPTWTIGSSQSSIVSAIAFKEAAGGPTVAQLAACWYEEVEDLVFYSGASSAQMWEEDFSIKVPPIPTLAWDEVDWQKNCDTRVPELITQDEQPAEIPPVVIVWNPAFNYTQGDDWDWSKNFDTYALQAQLEQEEWLVTYATPINFFDDFEDQNWSVPSPAGYFLEQSEDEQPAALPIIPATQLTSQFDDYDWNFRFDTKYALSTTEDDTGLQPILVPLPVDEGLDQKFFALYFVPQPEDDLSLIANFPPPPLPTMERNEEETWQHRVDYWLAQATAEEDMPPQRIIPTAAWDEVDWQRYFDLVYSTAMQQEQMEDQTYGWFLNPPPVPPPPFCPLPPFGPDADVKLSIFGGAVHPTLALFCRICKSGNPLVVRADYAIWCQDCCAFVSKQDTYMGTVQAPGVFRSVF